MKYGFRTPSLKKSLSARFSVKRKVKNALGLRMPRGTGWITNPKKYVYNKVYHRTTFGIGDLFKSSSRTGKSSNGCLSIVVIVIGISVLIAFPPIGIIVGIGIGIYYLLRYLRNKKQKEVENDETVYTSPIYTEDKSPKLSLIDWFDKEFTKEEFSHMEEIFQPLGGSLGLRNEIKNLAEKSVLSYLTNLSGWFDNPRDRKLALKLIDKAEEYINTGDILDKHFFWSKKMELYYKLRDKDLDALNIAVQSAQKQIDLAPRAGSAFLKDNFKQLPCHAGYTQLAIILDKQGKYDEAIVLIEQAKSQGWNGDWDERINRLKSKKLKKYAQK